MKYKLINQKTKEERLCDKITADGFDYYVREEEIRVGDWYTWDGNKNNAPSLCTDAYKEESILDSQGFTKFYKVIATTNPNIDVPKVVDVVEKLFPTNRKGSMWMPNVNELSNHYRQEGYNKSQETHPFSEDDMIEFWIEAHKIIMAQSGKLFTPEELIQLWKEQQPKIVYYG